MTMTSEFDWEMGEDAFPMEDVQLTGDKRTEARLCVVQVVFSAAMMGKDVRDAALEMAQLVAKRKADKKLFGLLVEELGAAGMARYVEMIQADLREEWPWERMEGTLRAILLVGAAELTVNVDAPVAVVIDEYMKLAKGFLAPEEAAFVNKMLDTLAKKVR